MAGKPQQGGQNSPQPDDGKGNRPQNQGQQQPAEVQAPAQGERPGQSSPSAADLSKDIQEKLAEWGQLTPRQRAAVMEGADEVGLEKYRKLVDDYYRTLATKATEK